MRICQFLFFAFLLIHQSTARVQAGSIEERIYSAQTLMYSDPDSAIQLAEEIKTESIEKNHDFGIVKANFILGYIHDAFKADYGKAIIYYLEAIRNGDNGTYQNIDLDKSILNQNSAVIFRKFKSYDLSYEYNMRALEYALSNDYKAQLEDVQYNLARLYVDQKNYKLAIATLESLVSQIDNSSNNYWMFHNRLGNTYHENQEYAKAIAAHKKALTQQTALSNKDIGYSYHNIARSYANLGENEKSNEYFNLAIERKSSSDNFASLFQSYKELGELKHSLNSLEEAFALYTKAEGLVDEVTDISLKSEFYKSVADAYYEARQYEVAKKYENLHSEYLNKYISIQEQIKDSEMNINIELVTKRYFDKVEKQERISYILLVSKLTSGSLLVLLLLVIFYNRYEKVKLRKSIENELIALRMID